MSLDKRLARLESKHSHTGDWESGERMRGLCDEMQQLSIDPLISEAGQQKLLALRESSLASLGNANDPLAAAEATRKARTEVFAILWGERRFIEESLYRQAMEEDGAAVVSEAGDVAELIERRT